MAMPKHINSEAVALLEQNGWSWSEYYFSFRRVRAKTGDRLDGLPDLITYDELDDHALNRAPGKDLDELAKGLQWLRSRLGSNGSLNHEI